jgi:hypothetical protein
MLCHKFKKHKTTGGLSYISGWVCSTLDINYWCDDRFMNASVNLTYTCVIPHDKDKKESLNSNEKQTIF